MGQTTGLSRLTMGKRLLLINVLMWVGFGIVVGIMFWSFGHIQRLLSDHVAENVDQIMDNARIARRMSLVFADTSLLLGRYHGNDDYVNTTGKQIRKVAMDLEHETTNERLKIGLHDFEQRLKSLLDQCSKVNSVLSDKRATEREIYTCIDQLDELISQRIVSQVSRGEDASIMSQRSAMVSGYRESVLKIEKLAKDSGADHFFKPFEGTDHPEMDALDVLHMNLLTFTAPDPKANQLIKKLVRSVRDYRSTLVQYHQEMAGLASLVEDQNRSKNRIVAIMESIDESISRDTSSVHKDMAHIISSTATRVLFLSISIFVIVGAVTAYFLAFSIKRPMESIRAGIFNWGEGDLSARIHLSRHDEWRIIEDALNSMASDLSKSYAESARRKTELEIAEEKYRSIFENSIEGIYQTTPDGKFVSANPAMARVLGFDSPEDLMQHVSDIAGQTYADSKQRERFVHLIRNRQDVRGFEIRLLRKDGEERWVSSNGRGIFDDTGNLVRIEGILVDITERKRLEEQLRQAAKMQAIGQLAGGVAHDFNNLLTAIIGYSDILIHSAYDASQREKLQLIREAAERASGLTQQLLAFGRKQVLEMKRLNVNDVVVGFEKMLRRLIGETVEIVTILDPNIGVVYADPGMIEQILMNLAVNARDAMSGGGTLTIETADVELDEEYTSLFAELSAGPYVCLAVSDTGKGIEPETIPLVFDPFFTTKEKGVGTGLGLSTVFGIVKQHQGNVTVYSEPGHGTTFKVYLPRSEGVPEQTLTTGTHQPEARGTETIMIVEDEEIVRNLALEGLEMMGYSLLAASDPEQAIAHCRDYSGPVHLLLTDVVLPQMDGKSLYNKLRGTRPEMRVLFVSGYTENFIVHHGVLDKDVNFLQKPFTLDGLAKKVREVLDG